MRDESVHSVASPLERELSSYRLVLGSSSPRRIDLLRRLVSDIDVRPSGAEETYDPDLSAYDVPTYLACVKASGLRSTLRPGEILVTADTIVILDGRVIGKPGDMEEAEETLRLLSGRTHEVITGYALTDCTGRQITESVHSYITFASLSDEEIAYYLTHFDVLDKAGAYGVQEWIGLIGVTDIRGSYHNIMGLPTASLYRSLRQFVAQCAPKG